MSSPKIAKALSACDASYIAGLVDGEGTVTLTRKHRGEFRQLAVSVSSTEAPLLDFILERTGVGKITNKRRYQAHHLPSYTYSVHNRQALALLQSIEPYLKSYKSRRAKLALQEYLCVTPRNGKYSADLLAAKRDFEKRFLEIRPHSS
ncbi:MAG: LAGLIDADG family homing endonuclease [Halieaceae bacterium]|jgi:hypothetical protein|nr:LAGLIDADG family homing endonuclease [Halieaceae bacterium]